MLMQITFGTEISSWMAHALKTHLFQAIWPFYNATLSYSGKCVLTDWKHSVLYRQPVPGRALCRRGVSRA